MSRKIERQRRVVAERVLELALQALGEVALVVRVGQPVAQRRLGHLALERLVQPVLVGEPAGWWWTRAGSCPPRTAPGAPPARRCSRCRWSSRDPRARSRRPRLTSRACSRERPSSIRRMSTLSPRPMTMPVLLELVHLRRRSSRPAPAGRRPRVAPRSAHRGAGAVRVVSSSGLATRSRVIPPFYRAALASGKPHLTPSPRSTVPAPIWGVFGEYSG